MHYHYSCLYTIHTTTIAVYIAYSIHSKNNYIPPRPHFLRFQNKAQVLRLHSLTRCYRINVIKPTTSTITSLVLKSHDTTHHRVPSSTPVSSRKALECAALMLWTDNSMECSRYREGALRICVFEMRQWIGLMPHFIVLQEFNLTGEPST